MLILLKSLARTVILPPASLLILAVVGLLLLPRRRRLGVTLVVISVGSLWLCAMPVVSDGLMRIAERCPPLDPSKPVNAQAIVILGGGGVRFAPEYGDWALEADALERVVYGGFLARRTGLPVLVTGTPDEALAMSATFSRAAGVPVRWVENRSGDTFENARFSARILNADGIHRILLVTSSPHEFRAAREFTGAGLEVVPAPVGGETERRYDVGAFIPTSYGLRRSTAALYELIGEPMRVLMSALHLRRQQAPG
ncbi:MAG TPA: YdcF family protein [Steroidobacteraceae bacterium]